MANLEKIKLKPKNWRMIKSLEQLKDLSFLYFKNNIFRLEKRLKQADRKKSLLKRISQKEFKTNEL